MASTLGRQPENADSTSAYRSKGNVAQYGTERRFVTPRYAARRNTTQRQDKEADMKHEMILLDADLRTVYARLSRKFREQAEENRQEALEEKHEQHADHAQEPVEF
jgi:hypothetical protein